jgi:hypothetical protein
MPIVFALLAIIGLIIFANWLVVLNRADFNRWFDWFLLVLSASFLALGLVVIAAPPEILAGFSTSDVVRLQNPLATGVLLLSTAVWGMVVSFQTGRAFLARWLPINPKSPVHGLALVLSGALAGSTLLTLTQGGLEGVAETAVPTPLFDFVLQQSFFVLLAVLGVGLAVRRRVPDLWSRLGLERPSRAQLKFGLRWIAILLAIQWTVGVAWALAAPAQSELLGGISDVLVGNFDTLGEWFVVALGAGIGEEILFRGALQPIFGLWFTSILFAVAHIQYGITPITILVFVISLALGYIRRRSNTAVAIFVHAGYDFVLGLLYLLAVYLQPFAG